MKIMYDVWCTMYDVTGWPHVHLTSYILHRTSYIFNRQSLLSVNPIWCCHRGRSNRLIERLVFPRWGRLTSLWLSYLAGPYRLLSRQQLRQVFRQLTRSECPDPQSGRLRVAQRPSQAGKRACLLIELLEAFFLIKNYQLSIIGIQRIFPIYKSLKFKHNLMFNNTKKHLTSCNHRF